MLHRLRRAMVRPARERLSGKVEVDETYVGGPGRGLGRKNTIHMRHWRSDTTKAIVVVAVEVHEPKGFGRIRMRRVPQASGKYLLPFVSEAIAPGSLVHTDGLPIYQSLPERGYRHERSVIYWLGKPSARLDARVASLLKRWLLGTHQGAVQAWASRWCGPRSVGSAGSDNSSRTVDFCAATIPRSAWLARRAYPCRRLRARRRDWSDSSLSLAASTHPALPAPTTI